MDTLAPARTPGTRSPRPTLWLLRTVVSVQLAAVLAQPVLAGLFLTGDVDAITVHGRIGSALAAWALVVAAVTALHVLVGRGRLWVLVVGVGQFFVIGLQIGMGYARTLQVHIPLGVAIVTLTVLLAAWVWSPYARRSR